MVDLSCFFGEVKPKTGGAFTKGDGPWRLTGTPASGTGVTRLAGQSATNGSLTLAAIARPTPYQRLDESDSESALSSGQRHLLRATHRPALFKPVSQHGA